MGPIVIQGLAMAISDELSRRKFEYFLGGSRRFGYDVPASDLDFQILMDKRNDDIIGLESVSDIAELMSKILQEDVIMVRNSSYDFPAVHHKMKNAPVDLMIYREADAYFLEKDRHEKLASVITRSDRQLVRSLKLSHPLLKGKDVYRALCEVHHLM